MSMRLTASNQTIIATPAGGVITLGSTTMGWVRRIGAPTGSWSAHMLYVHNNGSQLIWTGTASDGHTLELFNGSNTQQSGLVWETYWNHFALVVNSTAMKLYINSILVQTFTDTPLGNVADYLYLLNSNFAEWGNGEIQDVRVWEASELTQVQIAAEYASTTPVLLTNLTHHWPMLTNADTGDTIGGATLVLNGAVETGPSQPPGYDVLPEPSTNYAILLAQDQGLYSTAVPPVSGAMTFMAWFKNTDYPTGSHSQLLWASVDATSTGPYINVWTGDGGNKTKVNTSTGFYANTSSFIPAIDEWFHIAIAGSDSDLPRLYINGVYQFFTNLSGPLAALNKFSISDTRGVGESFIGAVKAVKIFNYAMSEFEVNTEMNKVMPQNSSRAFAIYPTNGASDLTDIIAGRNFSAYGGTLGTVDGPPVFGINPDVIINTRPHKPKGLLSFFF